jgi:hypothetical protein
VSLAATESDTTLAQEVRRNLTVYAGQHPAAPVTAVYVAEPVATVGAGSLADRLTDKLPDLMTRLEAQYAVVRKERGEE